MPNKVDQMNIRLSPKLKDKLQELAKENEQKTSDFVRQTLEDAIEGKVSKEQNKLNLSNFTNRERHILQAAAFIAHVDTEKPMIDCMKAALQTVKAKFKDLPNTTTLKREEREEQAKKLNTIVAKELGVSPLAVLFIRIIILTFFGLAYDQDIFQMSPLSIETIEEMRKQLNKQKAD